MHFGVKAIPVQVSVSEQCTKEVSTGDSQLLQIGGYLSGSDESKAYDKELQRFYGSMSSSPTTNYWTSWMFWQTVRCIQ